MTAGTPLSYEIVPWVRRGLATLVSGAATGGAATLPVTLTLNGGSVAAPAVRLIGPGDITGIDARAITRTDPRDATDAFEPNYLAIVEFDAPDFPWMCTPAGVNDGRLTPWVCLVVVPDGPGATLSAGSGGTSVLRIGAPLVPKDELPDLTTIDTWAHAQVIGSGLTSTQIGAAFDGDPALTCSRLIASRKLDPDTAYIACVVPTYRAGVNAGLGLPVDPADTAPGWDASVTAPFSLPSYYAFRFRTGPAGDFASLARKIVPVVADPSSGTRDVDMSAPGFGAAPSPGLVLGVEGALRVFGATTASWPAGTQVPYQAALRTALTPPPAADPIVAPPTYGNAQTGSALPTAGDQPVWIDDLNLDPRERAVAGAGTQVVQAAREALAGAAWQQAGEIQRANALLARAQLARAVTASLATRHLNAVSDGSYLQMTAPLHARVAVTLSGSTTTLRAAIASSSLPNSSVAGAFRKLLRPRGAIGRQVQDTTFGVVARLNTPPTAGSNALQMLAPAASPRGMVAFDDVATTVHLATFATVPARAVSGWNVTVTASAPIADAHIDATVTRVPVEPIESQPIESQPIESKPIESQPIAFQPIVLAKDPNLPTVFKNVSINIPPLIVLPTNATDLATFADRFGAAAKIAGTALQIAAPAQATFVPLGGAAALTTTRGALAARLDPERTIAARAGARVPLRPAGDPLGGVRNAPSFPQAMYEPLAELSPEWLLPGIAAIVNNSATALAPNDAFVEAYLIGLNEEMSRELLWRGFPLDLRSTFFQNFWGVTADIPAIGSFAPSGELGTHVAGAGDANRIVLLVRASLFARYPNAVVAAVRAQWSGSVRTLSTNRQYPLFRGAIGSDIRFFGFDIPDARGNPDPTKNDPGWYFAIEQHATEPRFGLEPDPSTTANPTWNDLSWKDVTVSGAFLDPATAPVTATREGVAWSADAATMAFVLERRPVRAAMHALALLGPAPAVSTT
jgi:hypothetical protein